MSNFQSTNKGKSLGLIEEDQIDITLADTGSGYSYGKATYSLGLSFMPLIFAYLKVTGAAGDVFVPLPHIETTYDADDDIFYITQHIYFYVRKTEKDIIFKFYDRAPNTGTYNIRFFIFDKEVRP